MEKVEKCKLVVTEPSRGGAVQRREYSQLYCNNYICVRWGLEILGGPLCKDVIV